MDEASFQTLADAELSKLEAQIEDATTAYGIDCDIETQAGGILQLEFENGGKIIINRHTAAQQIWVAARSGGYHFSYQDGLWVATRDGAELRATLSTLISLHSGRPCRLG